MRDKNNNFPGGSRTKVNKVGDRIRQGIATTEDLDVIEQWRSAHRAVLNTFQAILRNRTKYQKITVAQRHKRKVTIFDKLLRLPSMQLSRMDDVAGCRLIFENIESLYKFRKKFLKSNFHHKLKNDVDKYDYIKTPKSTGYRGIHDVYGYDVNSTSGQHLKGLLIEIQYRTEIQHAWATAVEVIGFITASQPKFQKGDDKYLNTMAYASEILARAYEECNGPHPEISDRELIKKFLVMEKKLGLLNMLRGLNEINTEVSDKKNVILIFSDAGDLEAKTYRSTTEALRALFELESDNPEYDIVLVKADTSEEVRFAFKNYFSDTKDFVNLVENACSSLSGKEVEL